MRLFLLSFITIIFLSTMLFAQHSFEYKGVENCALCHSGGAKPDVITPWSETKHAIAYDSLAFIQQNDECLPCHTTGWDTTETAISGGFAQYFYDENQEGIDRMKNVQCESCHTPTDDNPLITLGADNCGDCHEGSHHPTYSDWQGSLHAVAKTTSIPGGAFDFIASDPGCAGCHTAEGFLQFIEQEELEPNVEAPGMEGHDLTCASCHDPHNNEIGGQLRLPATELCAKCHNPEYSPDSPTPDGSDLHHTTAYMFEGTGGYEYDGYDYNSSLHTMVVTEKCVACHVYMTPFEDPIPANTGHSFEQSGESCVDCHNDFVINEDDFDYRGIQSEMDSLLNVLHGKLESASSSDSTTDAFFRAKFNYDFVHADGSEGIHNTKYARALLTSAIANFSPTAIGDLEPTFNAVKYALNQNYPNPFNPSTTISFVLTKKAFVNLKVYNLAGQLVNQLIADEMNSGEQKVVFNAENLPSGIYIYKLETEGFASSKKMVLLK